MFGYIRAGAKSFIKSYRLFCLCVALMLLIGLLFLVLLRSSTHPGLATEIVFGNLDGVHLWVEGWRI